MIVPAGPYADFGSGHRMLIVTETDRPGRVVYVLDTWLERAAYAEFGWRCC
jgi:hypothetical protein